MAESDDEVQLSDCAKKALEEFYLEQKLAAETNEITEDWQLSQFWYTQETSLKLAKECIKALDLQDNAKEPLYIACISCPSVMEPLMLMSEVQSGKVIPYLFEFDHRFESKYPDNFQFFDYNHSDEVDSKMIGRFSLAIADPPFLSDDCQLKTAIFTRRLLKDSAAGKIILCTGATMEEMARRAFGANRTNFEPQHQKNLSNAFACFTNYPPKNL